MAPHSILPEVPRLRETLQQPHFRMPTVLKTNRLAIAPGLSPVAISVWFVPVG